MAATPTNVTVAMPAGESRRLSPEFLTRLALTALAVGICYLFDWRWLRYLTSEFNLALDALLGMHLQRLSLDAVEWHGVVYRYRNACTFADVWCGAIPLIWNLRKGVIQNMRFAVVLGFALFAFNVYRLTVSDVLFAAGIPWNIAHHVISGVSYFLVWQWIWKHRTWSTHIPTSQRQ